jgi:comEA protein
MIYFTRHEQRIIIALGVIILLGTGVLLIKRFQPGWIMRLSLGKPDFDVEKDQISPRLKGDTVMPANDTEQKQQLDQKGKSESVGQAAQKPDATARKPIQSGKININTASKAELENLPRIGPVMAQRIIDYRQEHGAFRSIDELANVRGIGDVTLQRLRALITLGNNAGSE